MPSPPFVQTWRKRRRVRRSWSNKSFYPYDNNYGVPLRNLINLDKTHRTAYLSLRITVIQKGHAIIAWHTYRCEPSASFFTYLKGPTEGKLRKALHCKCSLTIDSLAPIFCLVLQCKVQEQICTVEIQLKMDKECPSNCAGQYWRVAYVPPLSGAGRGHRCLVYSYNKPSVVTKADLITTAFQNGVQWVYTT